jgi:hypothetical protein
MTFRIFTDEPDFARLGPQFRFGAQIHETPQSAPQWPQPRCMALVKDPALLAPLIESMPGVRRVPCGPDHTLFYSESGGCAAAALPATRADAERTALTALPVFVRLIMLKSAWFFMHAAAVRAPQCAVAFIGDNECGKSSLARALVPAGWDLLADDSLPLAAAHQNLVCALPVREAVNVRSLDAQGLVDLRTRGYEESGLVGFLLPPELPLATPAPLRLALYPEWGGPGAETLCEARSAYAYKKLLAACNTPLWGDGLEIYAKMIDQLLVQCRHFRIALTRGAPAPVQSVHRLMRDLGLPSG